MRVMQGERGERRRKTSREKGGGKDRGTKGYRGGKAEGRKKVADTLEEEEEDDLDVENMDEKSVIAQLRKMGKKPYKCLVAF